MVDVDEVTGFISVEAYGGIGFVAAIVEFFAVTAPALNNLGPGAVATNYANIGSFSKSVLCWGMLLVLFYPDLLKELELVAVTGSILIAAQSP